LREIIAHLMTDDMPSLLLEGPMCIILVTNHRDEILPGITHVLLLDDGGVVTQGPKESVLPAPPALSESSVRRHEGMGRQRQSGILPQETHAEVPTLDPSVLVQMEGVNVSYSGHQILHQIDWTVRRGEKWALLGPNGAGKTTLLSLLLGDNPQAYANDIRLFGRRRGSGESIWEIKRHIGWVAPELHLYHPKDVCCLDVVCSGFFDATGHHQRCSSQQRETARDWLHSLGVGQLPEVAFGQVSEGEQRLVLMGRALVKRPALLVLDEPCQGLDAGNRDRVLQVVETVGHQPDISLIYVTHQHDALPGIISHLLTLNEGRIVSRGKVDRRELSLKR
jgi:molybdate transport system ATP-binding protein